jgi:tetratricopeptide (TPR) repeat protein
MARTSSSMAGFPYAILLVMAVSCLGAPCRGQSLTNDTIWHNLTSLDNNATLPANDRLRLLLAWKKSSDSLHLPQDSVYARILHKIGALDANINGNYHAAIVSTLGAVRINLSGRKGASLNAAVTDLYNTAYFYDKMDLFKTALLYYDSGIRYAAHTPDIDHVIIDSRRSKAYIYFRMGDYEKAVEESDLGIGAALERKDSSRYLSLLDQQAQSLYFQDNLTAAWNAVQTAIPLGRTLHEDFYLASAYKTEALIYARQRKFARAELSFRECIAERIKSREFWQVAGDYNDLGNFYSDSLRSYGQSINAFLTAIQYAKKEGDSTRMARISLNLGRIYNYQRKYDQSMSFYLQAIRYLKISGGSDPRGNPTMEELSPIGDKELLQILFSSKTTLLLGMYKKTRERQWLTACLKTATLNDSLIMEIRHEQVGEQSKLYWRDRTRSFFSDALEACYWANDDKLAFYFMEKSRSVLLQDKLNEAGAGALLPPIEEARQDSLRTNILGLQEQLGALTDTLAEFRLLRIKWLQAKEQLAQFIASLESRYPNYYQYKYADKVRSLAELQQYLAAKGQRFVEYFIEDTTNFALCITPHSSRFIRIDSWRLDDSITRFLKTCSDEGVLNTGFHDFLTSANTLYRLLFAPFGLRGGRVIICQDNYLLPFEALSKDPVKPDFLVRDYAFSYVYSARYLMNGFENLPGKGDFLGIAPVGFGAYRGLPDLKRSEEALRACAGHYQQSNLLLNGEASRANFMREVSDYTVTTILTHAKAGSSGDEPQLFMKDSVIHLSELQILDKPATRLIILSACETNAGKNRSGEGIFSLARGFSAAGIPAVAATQWEADEQAIYSISEKFNEYIAQGLNKDEALQKAKLYYMLTDKKGSILPCYWADMILIGNTDPIRFSDRSKTGWGRTGLTRLTRWLAIIGILAACLILFRFYRRRARTLSR